MSLKIHSLVFENGEFIPSKYTCDGDDLNPSLEISEVPENAESLVLIMDDPDAPGGTFDHWVVFNISPDIKKIEEGEEPRGVFGKTGFGKKGYGGPCPPDGEHRYFFKLYALDSKLELSEGSTKEEVEKAMTGHILEKTELVGRYSRIN